jgi:hypothetical protein
MGHALTLDPKLRNAKQSGKIIFRKLNLLNV